MALYTFPMGSLLGIGGFNLIENQYSMGHYNNDTNDNDDNVMCASVWVQFFDGSF